MIRLGIMVTSTVFLLTATSTAAQTRAVPWDTSSRSATKPPASLRWPRTIGGVGGATSADRLSAVDGTSRTPSPGTVSYYRAPQPTACGAQVTPMPTMRSPFADAMPNVANVTTPASTMATASRACADSNRRGERTP